eukprot:CAMPEP_0202883004 /NCGR_PEP_ID=MMETSP1391-20130828/38796_1 /ASSEMBLY_ACC=CAM_ASM_000867 /TAXON_ID=1034604 /ORGANISM="Chlamydomonas leiostraca, Strain SAG 11-49" /LENGTH=173 /DNA_ID=CAMNT_0049565947 /DNA_START=14 /DNA_END=532 /DNA_ORIENTATION=+
MMNNTVLTQRLPGLQSKFQCSNVPQVFAPFVTRLQHRCLEGGFHQLRQTDLVQHRCRPSLRTLVRRDASNKSASMGTVVKPPGAESEIRWGSYCSKKENLVAALEEAVENILDNIGRDSQPELAIIFVSSVHGPDFDAVVPFLRKKLPSLKNIFGCSGYGVMGGARGGPVEVE